MLKEELIKNINYKDRGHPKTRTLNVGFEEDDDYKLARKNAQAKGIEQK